MIAFIAAIVSCKKSSDSTTTTSGSVVGFWSGSGLAAGSTTPTKVAIVFKSGNTMRFYGGVSAATDTAALAATAKSDGTYTVSGTNVTSTYNTSGVLLLLAATANSTFTTMTGTAGISPGTSGLGTFTFTKQ